MSRIDHLEHLSIETPFVSLVGHASRIRERVPDTGALNTKKPVLQNQGTALQSLNALKAARRGFTLLELVISLVVGAIFMIGMLPLIRMAATRGTDMQLQVRDVLELQSLVERLSAFNATNDVVAMKAALGGAGDKTIEPLGTFYLHSADYINFTTNHPALLEVRVGLSEDGPSLSKVFGDL